MFEAQTYETILSRMLAAVPDTVDKRQGSIIFDALAPAAAELTQAYIALDGILTETFADTASRLFLIRRAAEVGITPITAKKAVLLGVFNTDVPVGTRLSCNSLTYSVEEKITTGQYKVECETAGAAANINLGTMIPIDYVAGLTSATLTEVLTPGEDDESTESLRARYMDSISIRAFGGNVADYKDEIIGIAGVGGVKVFPAWAGGGTVKVIVLSNNYTVPADSLIAKVQELVDPVAYHGQGAGLAPIGHNVTVVGAAGVTVNIAMTITYKAGWTWNDVQPHAQAAIDAYFQELGRAWQNSASLTVRISQIESRMVAIPGVLDITATLLNGTAANLTLEPNTIAVRGAVSG